MLKNRYRTIAIIADIAILSASFIVILWSRQDSIQSYLLTHILFFIGLAIVWIVVSISNGKLRKGNVTNFKTLFSRVLTGNFISVSIIALYIFIFRHYVYSRAVVLGTAILSTVLELLTGAIYLAYRNAVFQDDDNISLPYHPDENELVSKVNGNGVHTHLKSEVNPLVISAIAQECGTETMRSIINMAGRNITERTAVLSTSTAFNILSLAHEKYDYIINLRRINDIKNPDLFIESVNKKLEMKGFFFCCVETKDQRKNRILKKFPPVLNFIYYTFDFIIKRILPKISLTRGLYFFLTRGENNVISRAEVLGRLCRAGFKINQESFIGSMLCIEAWKVCDPMPINNNTYSLLIALPRIGKEGKIIKVYKLRTMHPYSEYIQDYVYDNHDLREGGKFNHDFRITSWGSVTRKIWLDEVPMFINLIRREMKIVGVRPLSKQYFNLYKEEVRERRTKYKPGLIPPFYADMPSDLEEIQASEMKYFDLYDRHPVLTDFTYFWKSWWNILFRYARSK